MATRLAAFLLLSMLLPHYCWGQTVRFDTNVGNIDLILNPTGNGNLDIHVDNILRYVESGRYDQVVINRADTGINADDASDDFVMQFGGFTSASPTFSSFNAFGSVEAFDPVIVDADNDGAVDFSTENLSNTRGTVSLALGNNPNTGTSSFFANVGDNEFLDDAGFVPFARVADMSTVDYIMRLDQVSDNSAGLASSNIPVLGANNDLLVYVERAFVLDPNPVTALAATTTPISTLLADDSGSGGESFTPPAEHAAIASIPEPPALVLVVGAMMVLAVLKGPRRQY